MLDFRSGAEVFVSSCAIARCTVAISSADLVKAGTTALRAALARGETLEVAGYELHPELARAIEAIDLTTSAPGTVARCWFEVVATADRGLPPVAAGVIERWRSIGVPAQVHKVVGQPFWSTQEITECPALLSATSSVLGELRHAV